jgi:hypothetical protein
MERSIVASVVFAATVGVAGMAQAQTAPGEVYGTDQRYETPGKPSGQQAAPSAATSPALPSNSNPYWRTMAPGTVYPQQAPSPTNP